jgi:hypothetical protein
MAASVVLVSLWEVVGASSVVVVSSAASSAHAPIARARAANTVIRRILWFIVSSPFDAYVSTPFFDSRPPDG